ncbi:MAG: PaaI family thioesterase [Acidimicrobiales bacterium]
MPLCERLGIEVDGAAPDSVRLGMAWRSELCTSNGVLHGGAVMALADSAGATCAVLNLPAGAGTATIESKTNFFRAVRQGRIVATARPLHVGSSTIVIETEVTDEGERLVAKVTQTQAVLRM